MTDEELCEEYGWIMECESPLEIRCREGEGFASGDAAKIILLMLKERHREITKEGDLGRTSICKTCGGAIIKGTKSWEHVGWSPRHRAEPQE